MVKFNSRLVFTGLDDNRRRGGVDIRFEPFSASWRDGFRVLNNRKAVNLPTDVYPEPVGAGRGFDPASPLNAKYKLAICYKIFKLNLA